MQFLKSETQQKNKFIGIVHLLLVGKKHLWPVLSGSKSPDLKTICLDMTDDSHTDADIASGQRLSCGILKKQQLTV